MEQLNSGPVASQEAALAALRQLVYVGDEPVTAAIAAVVTATGASRRSVFRWLSDNPGEILPVYRRAILNLAAERGLPLVA